MAEYIVQDTTLRDLADEIRRETGKTDQLLGASMTDELRTFSDSLTEALALQNTALDDLEAELNSLEEGSGGSDSNKLALVVGTQSADNPYDITASDLEGATEIKEYAFYQGKGLRSIDTPTTCTSIGSHAFYYCSALASASMPNVTSISGAAFENCTALTSVSMPNVISIGGSAFYVCTALTSVSMPNATSMGVYAFYKCSALTSADMPNVTSIGERAFYDCDVLTSVSMPNVISIGTYAFQYCSALTSLTVPSTCTTIKSYALQCGSSTNKCTFTFEGTTPPSIQSDTFNASYINKIIVPAGCGETYKTATNWSRFASYIEEATE